MLVISGSFISPILFFPRWLSRGVKKKSDFDTSVSKHSPLLMLPLPDEVIRSYCLFICVKCLFQEFNCVTKEFFFLHNFTALESCYCKQFGWLTPRSCGERVLSCRNLSDQSHQREAGIPTIWWKLLVFPSVLTSWLYTHIPPPGESVLKRALLPW